MKKLLAYILILVALIGPLGFVHEKKARAEIILYDALGACTFENGTVKTHLSKITCLGDNTGKDWVEDKGDCNLGSLSYNSCVTDKHASSAIPSTTADKDTTYGTCIGYGWTDTKCHDTGGTFKPYDNGTTGTSTPSSVVPPTSSYTLLAPLPCDKSDANCHGGQLTTFDPTQANNIGGYLNLMIKIFIGLCAVLAMVMIVMGGIEWMTSELPGNKEHGKERIQGAVFGLVLALGAWTLLYTINPSLLVSDLSSLKDTTVDVTLNSNSIYTKPAADSARCTPVTSGSCTTSNLSSAFGSSAEAMSKICNIESSGTATNVSKTDHDLNGNAFSFGLFQINLLANGSKITGVNGESCSNLFVRGDGSAISGGNYIKKDSNGKYTYDAKLAPNMQNAYNDCKATLLDPVKNIQVAKQLPLTAWKYSDYGVCPSAFN